MNELKDSKEIIKRNKNFNEFKINEIKCANFYNINNNYNETKTINKSKLNRSNSRSIKENRNIRHYFQNNTLSLRLCFS